MFTILSLQRLAMNDSKMIWIYQTFMPKIENSAISDTHFLSDNDAIQVVESTYQWNLSNFNAYTNGVSILSKQNVMIITKVLFACKHLCWFANI